MKRIIPVLFLLTPLLVSAQGFPTMNQGDMQGMMQQIQKMSACMENLDKNALKQLELESDRFMAEMQSLCAAGKRNDAQTKAVAFAQQMQQKKILQDLRKCTTMVEDSMKPFMPPDFYQDPVEDFSAKHVCDDL